jgi:hypothetical protein
LFSNRILPNEYINIKMRFANGFADIYKTRESADRSGSRRAACACFQRNWPAFRLVRTQSTVQEDVVAAAVEAAGVLVEATQAPLRALMNCVSAELSRGKWVGCCAVR